jgi:hypothetical protein
MLFADSLFNENQLQMLASIAEGFWTYFKNTGDSSIIQEFYPRINNYMHVWQLDTNGCVKHRTGGWDWTDWGTQTDSLVIDNCWYYYTLKTVKQMAIISHTTSDTTYYASRISSLETNFDRVFWNTTVNAYRSPLFTTKSTIPDDRANGLAVVSGLAGKVRWPSIKTILTGTLHASPWMEKWVEEALFIINSDSAALTHMKYRYQSMVNSSNSTLFEVFTNTTAGTNNSPNHS